MKLQALYDLQQELSRLFVAGSRFSKNDPRLKKQQAVFEKLGEKAPVFKKIASNIDELYISDEKDSSEKLTALSQLLYAVLYTQGEAIEEDKEIKTQTPSLDCTKLGVELNYRQLSTVAKALTESGSGRLELIEEAVKTGAINNYRLFNYIDKALGDKYGEFANFISESVIPLIAEPMLPILLESFEYNNTPVQQRRFKAIARLNPPQLAEMNAKIVEERIPLLTIELIKHLPKTKENEELFISLAKEKNKDLRAEAERALSKVNSKSGWGYLVNLFISNKKGGNLENLSNLLSNKSLPSEYLPELKRRTKEVYDELLSLLAEPKLDDKKLTDTLRKLYLHSKAFLEKEDIGAAVLLKEIIQNPLICKLEKNAGSIYISFDYNCLAVNIANVLAYNRMYSAIDELIELSYLSKHWKGILIRTKFISCSKNDDISIEEVYNQFSEAYKKGIIASETLYENSIELMPEGAAIEDYLDKRWLPLLEEKMKKSKEPPCEEEIELCIKLVGLDSPQAPALFISLLNTRHVSNSYSSYERFFANAIKLFLLTNYPDKFEAIFQAVVARGRDFNSSYFAYFDTIGLAQFPKEYARKFREANVSGKNRLCDYIADIIEKE